MTLLEEYEQAWYQLDPCDPRYNDKGCEVCPNERRFDRQDDNRHWLGDQGYLDRELNFND